MGWGAFFLIAGLANAVVLNALLRHVAWEWAGLWGGGGGRGKGRGRGPSLAAQGQEQEQKQEQMQSGAAGAAGGGGGGGLLASVLPQRLSGAGLAGGGWGGMGEEAVAALRAQLPPIGACVCVCGGG